MSRIGFFAAVLLAMCVSTPATNAKEPLSKDGKEVAVYVPGHHLMMPPAYDDDGVRSEVDPTPRCTEAVKVMIPVQNGRRVRLSADRDVVRLTSVVPDSKGGYTVWHTQLPLRAGAVHVRWETGEEFLRDQKRHLQILRRTSLADILQYVDLHFQIIRRRGYVGVVVSNLKWSTTKKRGPGAVSEELVLMIGARKSDEDVGDPLSGVKLDSFSLTEDMSSFQWPMRAGNFSNQQSDHERLKGIRGCPKEFVFVDKGEI